MIKARMLSARSTERVDWPFADDFRWEFDGANGQHVGRIRRRGHVDEHDVGQQIEEENHERSRHAFATRKHLQ